MSKSNGKNKSFLKSKNKNRDRASLRQPRESRTLYVSLDNADTVIEGGALLRVNLPMCLGDYNDSTNPGRFIF